MVLASLITAAYYEFSGLIIGSSQVRIHGEYSLAYNYEIFGVFPDLVK